MAGRGLYRPGSMRHGFHGASQTFEGPWPQLENLKSDRIDRPGHDEPLEIARSERLRDERDPSDERAARRGNHLQYACTATTCTAAAV